MTLQNQILDIFQSIPDTKMELSPSQFAEKYRRLTSDVSTVQGKYRYDFTPYLREVVDTLSPYHPAKVVGIMKSAQIGFTDGVLVNGILWIIANNPGNIMALSADDDLSREMVESRLDQGIASCGIQHLIRPNTIRRRNARTGDTSRGKEFAGGRAFFGGLKAVDKLGKQRSIKYGFFDDWDAAPISDKEQGNIFDLIQQRFSTAADSMKQYFISTPQTRPSNIEKVYLLGDQRKWNVPCPECGEFIEILWNETIDGEKVGIIFDLDKSGKLVESSVGYVCQKCASFFKEKHKYEMNLFGKWIPTVETTRPGYYSYHINCLTAAPFMYGWTHYAHQWAGIYNKEMTSKSKLKVFINLVMGQPWEETKTDIKAGSLMKNTRPYDHGIIPNELAEKDGNGRIILLTCACDLNGNTDDTRIDWEVKGHSLSGSTYSIDHGSIGTYEAGNKDENRLKLTYRNGEPNNAWDVLYNSVMLREYPSDNDEPPMKILITGIDIAYMDHFAWPFIDSFDDKIIYGIRGGSEPGKPMKINNDKKRFTIGQKRTKLWILETNLLKDDMAASFDHKWSDSSKNKQPEGYPNFPNPDNYENKYTDYYFKQFENENRVIKENDDGEAIGYEWKRKYSSAPNHFMDCHVYNMGLRDIFSHLFMKELGIKYSTWADFVTEMKKYL